MYLNIIIYNHIYHRASRQASERFYRHILAHPVMMIYWRAPIILYWRAPIILLARHDTIYWRGTTIIYIYIYIYIYWRAHIIIWARTSI